MSAEEKNRELMKTLDDAWNSQEWDIFEERHADNVAVYWPGQPEPTRGLHNHREESVEFFKIFPDNHLVNNPYKILFSKDDYTCSVADFTGTFKGPMKGLDGKMIQPTNKKFHLEFCTVAHWKNGKILEERLFYDQVGMMKQIGVMQ
ncbi:MAG TPA: ester cyclase [Nitrososphaeraceae archaeon]|nr:ester cyclase [Nitrososphaeraceae archaeon]